MDGGPRIRLPDAAHTEQDWRIHDLASDFALEDVWALPTPGGPTDLLRRVGQIASDDDDELSAIVVRMLFAIRWQLGALLGWDESRTGIGARVRSPRERLPDDLRIGTRGPDLQAVPFTSDCQTDREWVAEIANQTVHALIHIGRVSDGAGVYRGQMAALVRPNRTIGRAYMIEIKPIRRTLVYPELIRSIGRSWRRMQDAS